MQYASLVYGRWVPLITTINHLQFYTSGSFRREKSTSSGTDLNAKGSYE